MSKTKTEIVNKCEKLMEIRKNPILILDIKEIDGNLCIDFNKHICEKQYRKIDVILQTPGGDIDAAFNIAKLIRSIADSVTIIVPLYAKSAGTLICLCADEILMTMVSELGPLDTQIREEREGSSPIYLSALNGFKALEQVQFHTLETLDIATKLILQRSGLKIGEAVKLATEFSGNTSGTLYHQLDPKRIGEYARALEIGERYGIMILTRYMGWTEDKAENLVQRLVKSYPNHRFIIDYDELLMLGLPAKKCSKQEEKIIHEIRMELIKSKGTTMEIIELQEKKKNQEKGVKRNED